jgi:hypothetical protein
MFIATITRSSNPFPTSLPAALAAQSILSLLQRLLPLRNDRVLQTFSPVIAAIPSVSNRPLTAPLLPVGTPSPIDGAVRP